MNKRIRELAEQAGFEFWQDEPWNPGDLIDWSARYDDEFIKFAELIVRECVTICNSVQEQYGQYTFTATTVKNRIQEHFGVE